MPESCHYLTALHALVISTQAVEDVINPSERINILLGHIVHFAVFHTKTHPIFGMRTTGLDQALQYLQITPNFHLNYQAGDLVSVEKWDSVYRLFN